MSGLIEVAKNSHLSQSPGASVDPTAVNIQQLGLRKQEKPLSGPDPTELTSCVT